MLRTLATACRRRVVRSPAFRSGMSSSLVNARNMHRPIVIQHSAALRRGFSENASGNDSNNAAAGLSPETIAVVKATAPVLAEHGYAITTTMYGKMLTENPAVKEMFNATHQVVLPGQDKARQPQALANSIYAYAANIENLEALTSAVEHIAQKHASLYVLPEHYPVVAENLIWAIKEVLGDAATPEVVKAWTEAYWFLADIFIKRETQIREEKAAAAGGWEGWRDFVVREKVQESSEITSFYLEPSDGGALLDYTAGSYIALRLETPEFVVCRNYTLSSSPGQSKYRISVKKEGCDDNSGPPGLVSTYLHEKVNPGDVLKIGVPCGDFLLKPDPSKPVVLISGGVGITPTVSMLEYLVERGFDNNIVMINSARSPEVEAMHDSLAKYRRKHLNLEIKTVYDEGGDKYPQGPLTMDQLDSALVTRDCHYYVCGPPAFMRSVYQGLKQWQIADDHIHSDFFGPLAGLS